MQPGAIIAGRYRITRLAGTGGMASVYEAVDPTSGRKVAVKLARFTDADAEQRRRRFDREARAMSRLLAELGDPGLVAYLDHGVSEDGQPYLVMEWLEGHDLQVRLRERPLSVAETIALGRRVAVSLAAVHERGVIHRDIKPSNLFLVGGEVAGVKLIDFGVARVDAGLTRLTGTGAALGTPSYMAPEQARGQPDVDARADLYALGAVLFACLTGRPPFVGDHAVAVLAKMQFEEAPRVGSLRRRAPRALDELIAGLLAKDPARRPGSAAEVASLLCGIADRSADGSGERLEVAVSGDEQRYLSVLLIGDAADPQHADAEQVVRALADACDGRLERIDADTVAVLFETASDAGESAARAARFALGARARFFGSPIVVATGRGQLTGPLPVGAVVDRAVQFLVAGSTAVFDHEPERPRELPIVACELTAALLEGRFDLRRDDCLGYILVGEHAHRVERRVLGRATPCVGRTRELRTVSAMQGECAAESMARAVLVTGPAGAGKSRLARELIAGFAGGSGERAEPDEPHPRVLVATGDAMRAGSPFAMAGQLILGAAGIVEHDPVDRRQDTLTRYVDERLSATLEGAIDAADRERIAAFLGELCGVPYPDEGRLQLREARRDPHLMHDQTRRAWLDWLAAETARGPLVVVLDDLQWSDPPSVRFVDAALRQLAEAPLLVVALARPEVDEAFPDLWAARDVDRITLRPLSRRACAAIAGAAMPEGISDATCERLIERSGGNPFYLEELLRAAAAGQLDVLPDTVLAMASARLEAVLPSERRVLRAASVFGRTFWLGGVAALLGDAKDVVHAFLGRLVDREIVVQGRDSRFADTREYRFAHDLVREAAYASLPDDDRVLAHISAGAWLQDQGEADPVVLAEHFRRGQVPGRALPLFHRAAEQALAANHFAATVAYAERAIACGAGGETLGSVRLLQAEAHNWSDRYAESARVGKEAIDLLPAGTAGWAHAIHHLSWACLATGDIESSKRLTRALCDHAPPRIEGRYLAAVVHCWRHAGLCGDRALAATLCDLAEQRTRLEANDCHSAAYLALLRNRVADADGDTGVAAHRSGDAIRHFVELGDVRQAHLSQLQHDDCLRRLGQYPQAAASLSQLVETLQRIEATSFAVLAQLELATALAQSDQLEVAVATLSEVESQMGDRWRQSMYERILAGQVRLLAGEPQRALDDVARAVELSSPTRFPQVHAHALAMRGQLLLALGRADEALQAVRPALAIVESLGALDDGDALLHLVHAEALHATGDVAAAREAIAAARDRLLARAERIDVPAWKASFVDRVPENRRTLERARAWLDAPDM